MNDSEYTCCICKIKITQTEDSKYFPFCSKRCQVIDLGAWASESYRVPSKEPILDSIDDEDLEN
jgi:endogenous inhibitor of DNA gyrase (YacG/DUF329 family)